MEVATGFGSSGPPPPLRRALAPPHQGDGPPVMRLLRPSQSAKTPQSARPSRDVVELRQHRWRQHLQHRSGTRSPAPGSSGGEASTEKPRTLQGGRKARVSARFSSEAATATSAVLAAREGDIHGGWQPAEPHHLRLRRPVWGSGNKEVSAANAKSALTRETQDRLARLACLIASVNRRRTPRDEFACAASSCMGARP